MPKSLDVVAIGNAIVDVIARIDDAFLQTHGVERGAMTLIDDARSEALYDAMPPGLEVSGGWACASRPRPPPTARRPRAAWCW